MPSNALDACGLLRTALRCRRSGAVPGAQAALSRAVQPLAASGRRISPFRSAARKVVKPGQSLTVITYGALVQKALLAATQVERRNPRGEHRDPRSAHAGALRLGGHPRFGGEDQPRDGGARRLRFRGATARRSRRASPTSCSPPGRSGAAAWARWTPGWATIRNWKRRFCRRPKRWRRRWSGC